MRIAGRKAAVGRDRVELVGVDHFEQRGIEVQAVLGGVALHLLLNERKLFRQRF
jgi:hypothetical protein